MEGIHRIIRLTLIAGHPAIASSYHTGIFSNDGKSRCFEILGFDILLDSEMKPWLLEVNCMPSLAAYSEFDENLKTRVVSGALKIIDLDASFKGKVLRRMKDIRAQKNVCANTVFDPDRESEIAKETEWKQLLPVMGDAEMAEFYDRTSISVRDLGYPKKGHPPPAQEAPPPRPVRSRKSQTNPKPKKAKPPPVSVPRTNIVPKPAAALNRTPRSVILANEARMVRLNALSKRPALSDQSVPIFQVFSPNENKCLVLGYEERERIMALRQQAQAGSALGLGQCIRALFHNGRLPIFPMEIPVLTGGVAPLAHSLRLVFPG
jgi:tubulin polyglutamylase TTLL6/13